MKSKLFGQAAQLLTEAGVTAGMGKLHSNLAATKLAVREPLAALDYCRLAVLVRPFVPWLRFCCFLAKVTSIYVLTSLLCL